MLSGIYSYRLAEFQCSSKSGLAWAPCRLMLKVMSREKEAEAKDFSNLREKTQKTTKNPNQKKKKSTLSVVLEVIKTSWRPESEA